MGGVWCEKCGLLFFEEGLMDEKKLLVLSRLEDSSPLPVEAIGGVERGDGESGLLVEMRKDGLVDQLGGHWFLTGGW